LLYVGKLGVVIDSLRR